MVSILVARHLKTTEAARPATAYCCGGLSRFWRRLKASRGVLALAVLGSVFSRPIISDGSCYATIHLSLAEW